jgi:hypothetical protein
MTNNPYDVFLIVSNVLQENDTLCMDTEAERCVLAAAMVAALTNADER